MSIENTSPIVSHPETLEYIRFKLPPVSPVSKSRELLELFSNFPGAALHIKSMYVEGRHRFSTQEHLEHGITVLNAYQIMNRKVGGYGCLQIFGVVGSHPENSNRPHVPVDSALIFFGDQG